MNDLRLAKSLGPIDGYPGVDPRVLCPNCGWEYVHFDEPRFRTSPADDCPLGTNGNWIEIPMWCESDHRWRLILGFHKGYTFMATVPPEGGE